MKLSGAELLCSTEMSGLVPSSLAPGDLTSGFLLLKMPMFKRKAMKAPFGIERIRQISAPDSSTHLGYI